MSMMKRHIQNCPREGKSPERTRTKLVIKRLRAWMELTRKSYAEWEGPKFILRIPVKKKKWLVQIKERHTYRSLSLADVPGAVYQLRGQPLGVHFHLLSLKTNEKEIRIPTQEAPSLGILWFSFRERSEHRRILGVKWQEWGLRRRKHTLVLKSQLPVVETQPGH